MVNTKDHWIKVVNDIVSLNKNKNYDILQMHAVLKQRHNAETISEPIYLSDNQGGIKIAVHCTS